MLKTVDEIKAALTAFREDQVAVLTQMAAERATVLETPWDWVLIIAEEADFTELTTDKEEQLGNMPEVEAGRGYIAGLRDIIRDTQVYQNKVLVSLDRQSFLLNRIAGGSGDAVDNAEDASDEAVDLLKQIGEKPEWVEDE